MSIDYKAILRDALTLPSRERAAVAAEHLASLDDAVVDDADAVRAAWVQTGPTRSSPRSPPS